MLLFYYRHVYYYYYNFIIIFIIRLYQNCLHVVPCVITGQRTQSFYRMLTGNTGTGSVRWWRDEICTNAATTSSFLSSMLVGIIQLLNVWEVYIYTPTTKCGGGGYSGFALSRRSVRRSVGRSVRLQFLSAL